MAFSESSWETLRLRARPPEVGDAPIVFEQYASDPQVARFTSWRPHTRLSETRAFLERCARSGADGSALVWSLWLKQTNELAGFVQATRSPTSVLLGYALARRFWGYGLMTEALQRIVGGALAEASVHRVWAYCDAENLASARVLERVGMQHEGLLRRWAVHPNLGDAPRDCLCYSAVRS